MSWNYVVTAHKASNVTHSLACHFTAPDDLNLVVSKCTHLEIFRVTPEGLEPMHDVPLYGRIATLEVWRPPGAAQDELFVSTERFGFCVLAYEGGDIVTRAHGDLSDRVGKPCDNGQLCAIEPECRMIGLHMYDGLFKVIPGKLRSSDDAFNIRLEELKVHDARNSAQFGAILSDAPIPRHSRCTTSPSSTATRSRRSRCCTRTRRSSSTSRRTRSC